MALIAQAHVDSPFDFSFVKPEKLPNPLLRLDEVSTGYGDQEILGKVNLSISPGDRIGLLGPNGAGKSTLIKLLVGELDPLSGEKGIAETLKIGYFAQHQLEQLRVDESPLWHIQKIDPKTTEKELRNFLGGFNFRGDKVQEKVAPFSGGEKARLVLALLVYQSPNLLLLDEPTNHLDLEMRHALAVALQDYQGAVVVVSHDRHLLRSVTDQFLLVANSRVQPFDGDLEDYRLWLSEQRNSLNLTASEKDSSVSKKDQRRKDAEQRKKTKPLRDAMKKAEKMVEKLHQDQHALEQQLAEPGLYSENEKERLKLLLQQKAEIDNALDEAEVVWMEASENLELAEG